MNKGGLNYTFPVTSVLVLVGGYTWVLIMTGGGLSQFAVPYLLALLAGVSSLWSP
jgi:hypothetical protein